MTIVKKFSEIADFLLQLWPFFYNNRGQHHIKSFYFSLKSTWTVNWSDGFIEKKFYFFQMTEIDCGLSCTIFMPYFYLWLGCVGSHGTISLFPHQLFWRSFEGNYNWFPPNSINPPNILRSVRRTDAFKSETSLK